MSNLELAGSRLSFDDLLEAVQDSKRGRWFLQEYETRIQKRDTQSILSAISKLENRMEHLGPQAGNVDDVVKVRTAISNARNDLFKMGLGKEAMSKEGRLFAEMAEMARKAIPEAGEKTASIVRTLQLVDEIDRAISPASVDDKGAKFFAADANLFDRPVATKPVLVEVAEPAPVVVEPAKAVVAKKEEPAPTGAKLVIRKVNAAAPLEATPVLEANPVAEAAAIAAEPAVTQTSYMPTSEMPKPVLETTHNPRIVIIRRRAEDMPEVAVGEVSAA